METFEKKEYAATRNACKVCTPLGACVAFKGIRGCVPLLHGSQGCSTYIRRYLISHYKEPVDIASTNFSQEATIFGGTQLFSKGIENIIKQYNPEVIAIASTCLSETIGEDISLLINTYKSQNKNCVLPAFVHASTPSYRGTHMDGFHEAVTAFVSTFSQTGLSRNHVNLFPGFVSPADLRYLKEIFEDFELENILLPDYSETFDNPNWDEYQRIPPGGTPINRIRNCGSALASIEFGYITNKAFIRTSAENSHLTAGEWLEQNQQVDLLKLGMPIGISETDRLFETLEKISAKTVPLKHKAERGRLIDSYIDGHKYVFGKRAIVYGEEDFVIGMVSFLDEIGVDVVLCASGANSGQMRDAIEKIVMNKNIEILSDTDFEHIAERARALKPDFLIGNSKGYYIARELGKPLIRSGFPIHDRIGGQRLLHLGYRGAQIMFDNIVNALIDYKQEHSPVGYKYM
jgi:nitrogenase molybdenum-iron protein NifN